MKTTITILLVLTVFITTQDYPLIPFWKHWDGKYITYDKYIVKTGIACPKCGEELNADYNMALTSNPIQYHAWCVNCGWIGYI